MRIHANKSTSEGKSRILGFLAGIFWPILGKAKDKPDAEVLRKADHSTSTQRIGLRLTGKMRDIFRFKWLRVR